MQGKILSKRYLIGEEIGTGGMGSVYRAIDLRTGGDVAIKIPHPFLANDPTYIERLRREAQIAASVYSPRVVRVMDLDLDDDGVPFLVMEYVPGRTLADELHDRGSLPGAEALMIALEIARALDAAGQKGVQHRDLKPHNIKLADGEVKVLDFGIARAEGLAGVTAHNLMMGTPEYCPPERIVGQGDIRSDIYALGVILYEMLVGQVPFSSVNTLTLLRQHEFEQPPPLPADVADDVAAIVMRCLEKRPEDRYQTPRELIQAIGEVLRSLPVPTIPIDGASPALVRVRPTTPAAVPAANATPDTGDAGEPAGATAAPDSIPIASAPPSTEQSDSLPDAGRAAAGSEAGDPVASPVATIAAGGEGSAAAAPGAPAHRRRSPRAMLVAGLAAGLLALAGIGAILALGGGSDTKPAVGQPTAATVVASVVAISPSSTPPPVPTPRPFDPPATIAVDTITGADERSAVTALNEANLREIEAYRSTNAAGLDRYFSGQALEDLKSNLLGLRRLGRYGISNLRAVELLSTNVNPSATSASITTRERQDYDEFTSGTNEPVADPSLHFTATLRWTYNLVKRDGRWLIDNKNFEVESSAPR